MVKNGKEIEKTFKPFHKKLCKLSNENNNEKLYKTFTRWYSNAINADPLTGVSAEVYITDESFDGGIDAVIEKDGQFTIIQSKYNAAYEKGKEKNVLRIKPDGDNSYNNFDINVIPAFKNKEKFEQFIVKKKIDPIKAGYYRKAFDAKQKDSNNLKFEFITTYDGPREIEYAFTNLEPSDFKDINDIADLHRLQEQGSTPKSVDLILKFNKQTNFVQKEKNFGIVSYVMLAELSDLVNHMKKYYPTGLPAIISRNVRTLVKNPKKPGTINNRILDSYNRYPEEFWLRHNGMTITCERLKENKDSTFTLTLPNVINGGQTLFSLREADKTHQKGQILLRIYEIEHNKKTDELLNNIIHSTNQQNPVYWHELRSLEDSQFQVAQYFYKMGVFYERRTGEHSLRRHSSKISGLKKCRMVELTQILKIAKDGALGVHKVKRSKEDLFKDKNEFNDLFNLDQKTIFFQYVIKQMVSHLFTKLNHTGKRFVLDTVYGIFWDALRTMDLSEYARWEKLVNSSKGKNLDIKNMKTSEIKGLKTLVNKMYNNCDDIRKNIEKNENIKRKKSGKAQIKYDLRIFVGTQSLVPIETAFKEGKKKHHSKIINEIRKLVQQHEE